MLRIFGKAREKVGLPPGTLVHIGEKKTEKAKITIIDFNEAQLEEKELDTSERRAERGANNPFDRSH